MTRRTLIVEIQPDAEDIENPRDREQIWHDVGAEMSKYGTVIALEWVGHDDNEED